jgi:hypothetical protein
MTIQEIIKRLQVVKNLLLLEDYESLALQIDRLQGLGGEDKDLNELLAYLKAKKYGDAIVCIDAFVKRNSGVEVYKDPEIEALKIELKALEMEVADNFVLQQELENTISQFEIRYHQELGGIIENILKLKKEKLKDSPKKEEYKKAEEAYEEFHQQHEELKGKKVTELSDEDKAELKRLYRKAATLCHPDKVSEEQKESANKLFQELNEANASNNIEKVRELLSALENNKAFSTFADTVNEKEKLKAEVNRLRQTIEQIKGKITEILSDEVYQKIAAIEDFDGYFGDLKGQLEKELEKLKAA